ncbi:MAG: DUF3592 domain-containing protein [Angustibacter sp.]
MSLVPVLLPVLTVAFALGGVLALRQGRADRARQRRSRPASGVVTELEYNASLQVFPTVRYTVEDGSVVQAQPQSSSNVARFVVGQQVAVRYDPLDPHWMQIDGLASASATNALAGVVLLVVAVVLAAVWWLVG